MNLKRISKALAAAVAGLAGAYGTALADGTISSPEWFFVIGTALLAGVGTYLAPKNVDPVAVAPVTTPTPPA